VQERLFENHCKNLRADSTVSRAAGAPELFSRIPLFLPPVVRATHREDQLSGALLSCVLTL
jgi:hypothetical protein